MEIVIICHKICHCFAAEMVHCWVYPITIDLENSIKDTSRKSFPRKMSILDTVMSLIDDI